MVVLTFLLPAIMFAQSTKVKGRVVDADSGEGIPFVGVFFKDTQHGVTTDMEGYYTMEVRHLDTDVLKVFLLGYEPQETRVTLHAFNHLDFQLKSSQHLLDASMVRPDNRYLKWILQQVDRNRHRNNPEKMDRFQCNVYNKMALDLSNPEENLDWKAFTKRFGFVFDYVDTSVVSGQPCLPILFSEAVTRRYHDQRMGDDKEVIKASRISGLNPDNAFSHLTGSMHMQINFYDHFIHTCNIDIPSPISPSGDLYYNYYLIDSLQVDHRKTFQIRFHPRKMVSTPAFDGEMSIDAEDFALRSMHVKLGKDASVNWIRDLVIDVEHEKIGDSLWFYRNDRLYADIALQASDSSKLISMIAHRDLLYYEPEFNEQTDEQVFQQRFSEVFEPGAKERSESYWETVRPYALNDREKNVFTMVERVKEVPAYNTLYTIGKSFVSGYWEFGKISFGTLDRLTSYNNLEGRRFQLGVRTTRELSRKFRLTGYAAYALGDHRWKGGIDADIIFNDMPTRKMMVRGRIDTRQLGKGSKAFSETNVLSNLLSKNGGGYVKKSRVDEFYVKYEHEFSSNFSNLISLETQRIHASPYVPLECPDGTFLPSVASNYLRYTMRFSWDETVSRGLYHKQYLYTRYPVVTLDLYGGFKGLWEHDYNFLRTEATMTYNLHLPPIGKSSIRLNAGKIWGQVPYPMLKLHEGNSTYFLDHSAFSCMDYYEFASDAWVSCFFEHNFEGFFLGKIPLIRKLNLREVFTCKSVYGVISDKNNGTLGHPLSEKAILLFPKGMKELRTPYVEVGFGIANILKLFRVDFNWRLTHLHHEVDGQMVKVPHPMSINVGMEVNF